MTKKNKLSSQKRLAIAGFFAIFIALLFMISSVPAQAGTGHSQQETGFTTNVNYIPNPVLNSNVTWSTFYHNWKPLEYNNGSIKGNLTLNAQLNSEYKNPITILPQDIQANGTLTNDKLGTEKAIWENISQWQDFGTNSGGAINTITTSKDHINIEMNTSKESANTLKEQYIIPIANYPSNNIQYDYLTMIYGLSGAQMSGVNAEIIFANQTGNVKTTQTPITPNEFAYQSINLKQIEEYGTTKDNFNTSGKGYSDEISITPELNLPISTTNEKYTLTIYGFAFTYYPITMGTNYTGSIITQSGSEMHLSTFSPSFNWQEITENGYSVSISQTMKNETESQTSINNGVYTEQATYQGILSLPETPDLTYSNSYISMKMNITGKQFLVANMNGISYLSEVQAKTNGTFVFSTVNPNSANTVIIEVEYTTAQWTASSGAPSIWSIAGIEYYWYILLGAGLGLIGLGTGIKSHANSLRVGKR